MFVFAVKNHAGAGVGYFKGESALAIGISSISDNGSWVFKVEGSGNTEGDFGVSGGIGYQW
ncbi:MAG: YadA-like family protein [Sutterellaceae bacterium]|nr:YadA-like family protein [Sutterellaceae bacterium]MDY2869067.1 YadA-like family protein [Mesosutterella sp.]